MQKKLLDKVLEDSIGKSAVRIGDILYGKKNVNEFLIAKKLDLTINQIRNLLYKMAEVGLVYSMRKKDKKKGWYTYFWTLDVKKTLEFLRNELEKKSKEFQNQISSRETKRFYICENCHIEYNEENALLRDFICGECGNVLVLKDMSGYINEKRKELKVIEDELKIVNEEISKEEVVVRKKVVSKEKREKKKKDQERAEKRAVAKKLRDQIKKLEKKSEKKKSLKKISKKTKKKKKAKSVKKRLKKKVKKTVKKKKI